MSGCDRFEREAILRLEQGLPLDAHFDTCPDCRDAQATYQRLKGAIARAGSDLGPPAGWEDRVWQEVQRRHRPSATPRWSYLPWAAAAALAAAVGAPFILKGLRPEPTDALSIRIEVQRQSPQVLRGREGAARQPWDATTVQPGDQLSVEATVGDVAFNELRVYLNDEDLVLSCSGDPPCERRGDRLQAMTTMSSVGRYQAVVLSSASPIPPPSGEGLDVDAGRAGRAGASIRLAREVRVH
jgi:hypothetical protein